MKLRNKKTGEIAEFIVHKRTEDSKDGNQVYAPFAINPEEWEDCKEPKEYWYIDTYIYEINHLIEGANVDRDNFNKEIGNYFSSREEAERAVEKLKAWRRIKDKGFRFTGIGRTVYDIDCAEFDIGSEYLRERDLRVSELNKDLDLLFGGEE